MVGLDLSFPGGRYYIDTSSDGGAHAVVDNDGRMRIAGWSDNFHAMKAAGGPAAARDRVVELPGWAGGTVPSSFMFAMFHRWFVETAKREAGPVQILNCTEGGAYIDGMTHLPLAEALATMTGDVEVAGTLDAALATIDRGARLAASRQWRKRTVRDLRSIARLARAGAALAARSSLAPTQIARLERVERRLSGMLARHDFIAMLAQRDIDAALDEARRPASEAEYLRATARLLDAASRTATLVVDALTRSEADHGH
jgi:cob(I)alamin adenosyltransferase